MIVNCFTSAKSQIQPVKFYVAKPVHNNGKSPFLFWLQTSSLCSKEYVTNLQPNGGQPVPIGTKLEFYE